MTDFFLIKRLFKDGQSLLFQACLIIQMTGMDEHKTCARRNNHFSLLLLGLGRWCRIHENKIILRRQRFCQIVAAAYFH